jgi:D-2-hydroxyacid dehydrogenase (NADP+)
MKILLLDDSSNPYQQFNKKHVTAIKKISPSATVVVAKSIDMHKDTDIVITSQVAKLDILKLKNLRWIHLTSAGADTLPEQIKNSEILVTNSSGVHPIPIAEHVFGFMLMLTRKMYYAYKVQLTQKEWIRNGELSPIDELAGKTLGIVGLGRIGQRIAHLAKAFDMKVLAVVRNSNRKEKNVDELVESNKLNEVLKKSDFVVSALPGTIETRHLFNLKTFKHMKKSAYFINIGRGFVVNETDLVKALQMGYIKGAGLDVFETEPLAKSSPLWNMENVLITPHYSGWTPYYIDRVVNIFCENLSAQIKKKPLPQKLIKS